MGGRTSARLQVAQVPISIAMDGEGEAEGGGDGERGLSGGTIETFEVLVGYHKGTIISKMATHRINFPINFAQRLKRI